MESLYTKYRPQTFADVVGQTHVVTTLEHAVLEGRTSHAYLFCGPRGTGKTTMARLLAKALMCEQGEGHLPDGSCEQCRLIAAGEHPDVYELDAASRTGVDNVREEIISRVSFAPVRGRYKMYIIDEVHMLTTAAFNALLKTLEEPPSHVVFVLCTTDPQKIPETILSRVQRFDFHSIGNADIQGRLAYICEREGFAYDPEALELVVRHARGGMRDAISELEQLSVSGGGTISVDVARDVLGEVSASTLERMSLAMANRDVPTLFAQVEGLVEVGRDLLQFTRALAARLRDVYVVAAIGAKSASVSAADADLPAISREAQAFGSVDRVARALQLLSDASTEMRVAPNQRLVLEVALTKIARPQSELTLEALADRVASLERQVAALSSPAARREQVSAVPATAQHASKPQVAAPARTEAPAQQRTAQPSAQATAPAAPQPTAAPQAPAASGAQSAPAPQATPAPQAAAAPHPAPAARQTSVQQPAPTAQPSPAARQPQTRQQAPQPPQTPAAPAQAPAPTPAPQTAPQQPAPAGIQDAGELQRRWKQVVDGLLAAHPQHGSLLLHATLASDDGQQLLVSLPKGSGFACKMLDRPDVRSHVDPMIAQVFGPRKTHFAEADVVATIQARGGSSAAPSPQAPSPQRTAPAPRAVQAPAPQQPQAAVARQPQPQPQAAPSPTQQAAQPTRAQGTAPTPSTASQPAQRQAPAAPAPAPAAQTPSYLAPWEPVAYDDDQVPYDDMDVAPYEEDFLFGTVDPAQMKRPVQQAPAAPATPPSVASAPLQPPVPVAAPKPTAPQPPSMPPQAASQSEPQMAPVLVATPAPKPTSAPAAAPEPASAPAPQPQSVAPQPVPAAQETPAPEPAPAAPKPEEPAPAPTVPEQPAQAKPKAKRTSRQTGGIPNDIIAMLSDVFGEGITFTEVPPDAEASEEDVPEDSLSDADLEGEDSFADEPVDDADYEEDDE